MSLTRLTSRAARASTLKGACLVACTLVAFASAPANAAGTSTATAPAATSPSAARAQYARDTARCRTLPLKSTQRANCLSEASTALAQAQPDKPTEAPDVLIRNAMRRCDPLPEPDKRDCLARMQGQGTLSGSVASGGILRELVTREVVDPSKLPPTAAGAPVSGASGASGASSASGVTPPVPAPAAAPAPAVPTPQPSSADPARAPMPPTPPMPPAPPVEQVPPAGYPPLPMRPTP
ncbi:hypothetical protein AACH06_19475 [Ideonella sp. DXS29W]|uniref:Uncharacterized protein n=1 Tax=Ideonella lacteola TaxID=2984193 RepID=A0ABU9BSR3_9BURK